MASSKVRSLNYPLAPQVQDYIGLGLICRKSFSFNVGNKLTFHGIIKSLIAHLPLSLSGPVLQAGWRGGMAQWLGGSLAVTHPEGSWMDTLKCPQQTVSDPSRVIFRRGIGERGGGPRGPKRARSSLSRRKGRARLWTKKKPTEAEIRLPWESLKCVGRECEGEGSMRRMGREWKSLHILIFHTKGCININASEKSKQQEVIWAW